MHTSSPLDLFEIKTWDSLGKKAAIQSNFEPTENGQKGRSQVPVSEMDRRADRTPGRPEVTFVPNSGLKNPKFCLGIHGVRRTTGNAVFLA